MCQLLLQVTGFETLESLGGSLLALNVVESIGNCKDASLVVSFAISTPSTSVHQCTDASI